MAPNQATENATPTASAVVTRKTQLTVFDLATFADVKLTREVALPTKPTSIEEALALVGNDKIALLAVIHDGLIERAIEEARQHPETFFIIDEDAEDDAVPVLYTGTPVDEKKGKQINLMVLNLAKAMGFDKSLPKEERNRIKKMALQAVKDSPLMLKSLQGA